MNDLISRQALIEHLRRTIEASSNDGDYNEGFNDGMDFAACFASTLPSAQPEIIYCKDCKHNPKESWFGCPMSHLSEGQRPETAWCWKGERKDDERSD